MRQQGTQKASTLWSKISDQIFARFTTQGSLQDIGQIEIRVLPKIRGVSSQSGRAKVDFYSWIADPQSPEIQPLSFSLVLGSLGVMSVPQLAATPYLAQLLLLGILSSQTIDWDSFFKIKDWLDKTTDRDVKRLIDEGMIALSKAHDDLERPARDAGVITWKTKNSSSNKSGETRDYTKSGG